MAKQVPVEEVGALQRVEAKLEGIEKQMAELTVWVTRMVRKSRGA